jgi:ABC-type transport system involved in cytochrome bd biosynthesis fused ATPase/permease subunit
LALVKLKPLWKPVPLKVRDYNADGKSDWHDVYLEALSPITSASITLGNVLFTPLSALLHTIWFTAWFALGLDINLLTLIVSLEAIYITLFIGLGQKLQDKQNALHAKAEKAESVKAEAHREQLSEDQEKLLVENTDLTKKIEELTEEIHRHLGIAGKG